MNCLENLQHLAGIEKPLNENQQHYIYLVIDPATGEYTKFGQGPIHLIIRALETDQHNSELADVIKQQTANTVNKRDGKLSFRHEGDLHMFVPI